MFDQFHETLSNICGGGKSWDKVVLSPVFSAVQCFINSFDSLSVTPVQVWPHQNVHLDMCVPKKKRKD